MPAGTGRRGLLWTAGVEMIDHVNTALRRVPVGPLYLVFGAMPAAWLFWQGLTGGLGIDPIKALEHEYGRLGLYFLIAALGVTPLRRLTGVNLLRFRRMLGLVAFAYICAHLLVWLVLDVQIATQIWADIVKRPYITVGMAGFMLLVPLAVTSNNWSVKRLGALTWRRLHRLAYPATLLGVVHFWMQSKGFQVEPLVYLGGVVILLLLRARTPGVAGLLHRQKTQAK